MNGTALNHLAFQLWSTFEKAFSMEIVGEHMPVKDRRIRADSEIWIMMLCLKFVKGIASIGRLQNPATYRVGSCIDQRGIAL